MSRKPFPLRTHVIAKIVLLLTFLLLLASTFVFGCTGESRGGNSANESESVSYPSIETMIGQMMMVGFRGYELSGSERIVEDIRERNLGGVILFDYDVPLGRSGRNVRTPDQVRNLIQQLQSFADSDMPLMIAIDQEGGRVNRLKTRFGFPPTVSMQYLGEVNNPDSTRYHAERTASVLADLGININFAPVVDVNSNPDNPVIGRLERSFSANPDEVIKHSRIFLESFREAGLWGTVKHFPGHGSAWNDSHYGMADVTQTWDESELLPYKELFADGSAELVMSAHIFNENWSTEHPATLLPEIMTDMLREDLGFEGLLFSDDMQMGAITDYYGLEQALELAVNAGIDVLIFANNSVYEPEITEKAIRIINEKVDEGIIPESRIRESYDRITAFKSQMLNE